jgi:hypothetical protein
MSCREISRSPDLSKSAVHKRVPNRGDGDAEITGTSEGCIGCP